MQPTTNYAGPIPIIDWSKFLTARKEAEAKDQTWRNPFRNPFETAGLVLITKCDILFPNEVFFTELIEYISHAIGEEKNFLKGGTGKIVTGSELASIKPGATTFFCTNETNFKFLFEGKEIPMPSMEPGEIVVGCGKTLEHITNGTYLARPYEIKDVSVVSPTSVSYFYSVPQGFNISPLPQFGVIKQEYSHFGEDVLN